jgi:hypothetical protein
MQQGTAMDGREARMVELQTGRADPARPRRTTRPVFSTRNPAEVASPAAIVGDGSAELPRATGLVTVPWHPDGSGPVPTADGPVEHRWRKIIGRTLGKAEGDSLFGLSAQASFWCALSTAPPACAAGAVRIPCELAGRPGHHDGQPQPGDDLPEHRLQRRGGQRLARQHDRHDPEGWPPRVFLVASTGLRLYLSYVYSHGLTYGALATPITSLLFYYCISMATIIGAQFNNALLGYYPPVVKKPGRRSNSPAEG